MGLTCHGGEDVRIDRLSRLHLPLSDGTIECPVHYIVDPSVGGVNRWEEGKVLMNQEQNKGAWLDSIHLQPRRRR